MGSDRRRLYSILGGWLMSGEVLYSGRVTSTYQTITLDREADLDKETVLVSLAEYNNGHIEVTSPIVEIGYYVIGANSALKASLNTTSTMRLYNTGDCVVLVLAIPRTDI